MHHPSIHGLGAQAAFFQKGCQFVHADGGLYTTWAPQSGLVAAAGHSQQQKSETEARKVDKNRHNDRFKTRMCHYVLRGKICPQGYSCSFAHSEVEMRKPFRHAGFEAGMHDAAGSGARFKTRLCVHWVKSSGKWCPLGTRCRFAHGEVSRCLKRVLQRSITSNTGRTTQCSLTPQPRTANFETRPQSSRFSWSNNTKLFG